MASPVTWFQRLDTVSGVEDLAERGRSALRKRQFDAAFRSLLSAMCATHSREEVFSEAAHLLSDAFESVNEPRFAVSIAWYLGDSARMERLMPRLPPVDRARCHGLWAAMNPNAATRAHRSAAQDLEGAELLVRSAIHYEKAGDFKVARTLWSRLCPRIKPTRDAYAEGLAYFNIARCSRSLGDERGEREATIEAVHLLEEAADRFESTGLRERAFDCYHVLIAIGELTQTFEHVLEGAVNAVRILSEDNLRYHALRLQGYTLRLAEQAKELSAAATLAREMTDYARRQSLGRVAAAGVLKQAQLWQSVADATLKRSGPPQLAENALVASLLACAEAGHYARVGALYARLAEIAREPSRREHYARASKRYSKQTDPAEQAESLEDRVGQHVGPPDVWHVDLLEWEQAGNPAEACADVLLDPEEADDRIMRRATLLARLAALALERAAPAEVVGAQTVCAGFMTEIGLYQVLAPLEKMFDSDSAEVRLAAIRALSRYFYKRTFVTLERALQDPHPPVVKEAVDALERLRFDHAFEPLSRIFRVSSHEDARLAALKAIARIDVVDAAELLMGVLEHGSSSEQRTVVGSLKTSRSTRFFELARSAYPQSSAELRATLSDLLSSRGIPLP
ncbi:MAG: HEAT repeat domain-containing protein [Polyangiaceae bacterium]